MPWAAPLHHALLCLKAPSGAEEPGGGGPQQLQGKVLYATILRWGGTLTGRLCSPCLGVVRDSAGLARRLSQDSC